MSLIGSSKRLVLLAARRATTTTTSITRPALFTNNNYNSSFSSLSPVSIWNYNSNNNNNNNNNNNYNNTNNNYYSFSSLTTSSTTTSSTSTSSSSSTSYPPSPLDQFRDSIDRETRGTEPVGRSWSVRELRRKSYNDLHKLWYVLYKERNMLLTEQQLSRRKQIRFPQPERLKKVKKSMGAIKHVLGERKRVKIERMHQSRKEAAEAKAKEEKEEEMVQE